MEYERQRAYDILLGEERGASKKADEDAVIAVKEFHISPEIVAEKFGVSLEKLQKLLNNE